MSRATHRPLAISLLAGGSMVYAQAVTMCLGIVVARNLGAEDYGLINLARNLFNLALVLTPLGLDLALQRHLARGPRDAVAVAAEINFLRFVAACSALVIFLALFCGAADYLESFVFPFDNFSLILSLSMLALPFATDMVVLGGAYRGMHQPRVSLIGTFVVQPTVRAVAIVAFLWAGLGLWGVIWGTLAGAVVAWIFVLNQARFDIGGASITSSIQAAGPALGVLRYAPFLCLSTIVFTLARSLDTLAVGYWASAADVGRYAMVLLVGQVVSIVGTSLGQTLGASVAHASHAGDRDRVRSLLKENMQMASILCAPLCVAGAFWGRDIDLVLGPSYRIERSVFVVAVITQWILSVTHYNSTVLSLTGRHKLELGNNLLALAVQLVACAFLVPAFGVVGAALGTLSSVLTISIARQWIISRILGEGIFDWKLVFPLFLAVAIAIPLDVLLNGLGFRAWWVIGLTAAGLTFIYGVCAYYLFLTSHQRGSIIRLLHRSSRS